MRNRRQRILIGAGTFTLVGGLAFLLACGCARDVRLTGKKLREVQVQPVSHFGLTLDENATPVEVAFAAMQAIRADATAKTPADREAALDIQFDLAAANQIASRESDAVNQRERLYNVVHQWTPTVSYYVADFPNSLEEASKRIVQRSVKNDEAELALEVNAPGAPPSAQVVMLVWLAKDEGLWRVLHFGFEHRLRHAGRSSTASEAAPEKSKG